MHLQALIRGLLAQTGLLSEFDGEQALCHFSNLHAKRGLGHVPWWQLRRLRPERPSRPVCV